MKAGSILQTINTDDPFLMVRAVQRTLVGFQILFSRESFPG